MPRTVALVAVLVSACGGHRAAPVPSSAAPASATLQELSHEAGAVAPLVHTPLARAFVDATGSLPSEPPRVLFQSADKQRTLTSAEAAALPAADRAALVKVTVDDELYYETKYGSPLAYARALDVLGDAGLGVEPGARILDFGYGGIGHLRMLAALGFSATGVDVDPFLRALYSAAGDQGTFAKGHVTLLDGAFPADPAIRAAAGGGYRVVVSKNVLKRGYIHPDRPADDRHLVHLGVDDATFLDAVHDALVGGGLFLVYNICPAPSPPDKPFVPWSDGRSPFSARQLADAGFDVLAFDRDDTDAIRTLGRALSWDRGEDAMDLEHDLSVLYTLARRRTSP